MLREMIKEAFCISFSLFGIDGSEGMMLSNTLLTKLWTSWNVQSDRHGPVT